MWTTKIERAKQHKKELQGEIKSFFDSNPYKIGAKSDSQTRRLIYYLIKADKVPKKVALITGDLIQNLRSALDHLIYQLFIAKSKNINPARRLYFPISENLSKYNKEKGRKTEGLSRSAKDLIDKIKPYKGGNDILWQLHELNNIDKHRLLVTVGSSFGSIDIGAQMRELMKKTFSKFDMPEMPLFIKPADILFPLEIGDELFVDAPDAKPISNMQFRFNIVLNEPGIIEGDPLMKLLQSMIDTVENLIPIFDGEIKNGY